jgi:hypothetical protein
MLALRLHPEKKSENNSIVEAPARIPHGPRKALKPPNMAHSNPGSIAGGEELRCNP